MPMFSNIDMEGGRLMVECGLLVELLIFAPS